LRCNRWNDTRLILVVLAMESVFELAAFHDILGLSPRQVLLGAPLSFAIFFIRTVLPTMVLIYAILLPRHLALTGSAISTVLLSGLTYAAMHLVEGWLAPASDERAGRVLVRPRLVSLASDPPNGTKRAR
jgi:hypothetical protein